MHVAYSTVLGRIMLGYELSDLNMMIANVNIASNQLGNSGVAKGLEEVSSFLQGLWAEGYFD
jgi:hypothetical protein